MPLRRFAIRPALLAPRRFLTRPARCAHSTLARTIPSVVCALLAVSAVSAGASPEPDSPQAITQASQQAPAQAPRRATTPDSRQATTAASRAAVTGFAHLLFIERRPDQAWHHFSPHLIQHDAEIGDGNHGDDAFLAKRRRAHPEKYLPTNQYETVVDNILADGDLVAIKSHMYTSPHDPGRAFVDIWRVADGQFVEHWDVIQPIPAHPLNAAGMGCGRVSSYAEARAAGDTVAQPTCGSSGPAEHRAAALATVQAYLSLGQQPGRAAEAVQRYVADDFIQHSPHIPAGKQALIAYFEAHAQERAAAGRHSYTARVLADGDFVLTHRRVTTASDPRGVAYADLYRVRDGQVVEHWDVIQPIPAFSVAGHSMVSGPLEPQRTAGPPAGP